MDDQFQPGEIVDIVIKGVRVTKVHESTSDAAELTVLLDDDCGSCLVHLPLWGSVTVTRVAPPDWPPKPGDLWKDYGGRRWFGVTDRYGNPALYSQAHGQLPAGSVLHSHGSLTLLYRDGAEPAEVSE